MGIKNNKLQTQVEQLLKKYTISFELEKKNGQFTFNNIQIQKQSQVPFYIEKRSLVYNEKGVDIKEAQKNIQSDICNSNGWNVPQFFDYLSKDSQIAPPGIVQLSAYTFYELRIGIQGRKYEKDDKCADYNLFHEQLIAASKSIKSDINIQAILFLIEHAATTISFFNSMKASQTDCSIDILKIRLSALKQYQAEWKNNCKPFLKGNFDSEIQPIYNAIEQEIEQSITIYEQVIELTKASDGLAGILKDGAVLATHFERKYEKYHPNSSPTSKPSDLEIVQISLDKEHRLNAIANDIFIDMDSPSWIIRDEQHEQLTESERYTNILATAYKDIRNLQDDIRKAHLLPGCDVGRYIYCKIASANQVHAQYIKNIQEIQNQVEGKHKKKIEEFSQQKPKLGLNNLFSYFYEKWRYDKQFKALQQSYRQELKVFERIKTQLGDIQQLLQRFNDKFLLTEAVPTISTKGSIQQEQVIQPATKQSLFQKFFSVFKKSRRSTQEQTVRESEIVIANSYIKPLEKLASPDRPDDKEEVTPPVTATYSDPLQRLKKLETFLDGKKTPASGTSDIPGCSGFMGSHIPGCRR